MNTSTASEEIRSLRVLARRDLSPAVIELVLSSADGSPLPKWSAGAHIDLRLGADLIRQYSLVEIGDGGDTWTVAVLIEDGGRGGSRLISQSLHVGAAVKVSGPRNHFELVDASSYLFIAGGIGVTPLIAMCRASQARGAEWKLVYLGRERAGMAYLGALEREFPGRIESHVSSEGDRFDVDGAIAALPGDTHVYCCGPDRLMNAVEDSMAMHERIPFVHLEHFHPRTDSELSENVEFTVFAKASGVEFIVPADESILMAADFEGVIVPGDCLEGTCGSCETRVLLGQVEHRDSILSPQARLESRTMMICVSRAKPGCSRLELDL